MGPYPDQYLVYAFKDNQSVIDQAGAIPADECFQKAADVTRFIYTQYGPYPYTELAVAFCISPPKY